MNKFWEWLDEAFSDENGKGSNQRLGRFVGLVCLQAIFCVVCGVALRRGSADHPAHYELIKDLFMANAILICGFYGITTLGTVGTAFANRGKPAPEPAKPPEGQP